MLLGIATGARMIDETRLKMATVLAIAGVGLVWLLAGFGIVSEFYAGMYESAAAGFMGPMPLKLLVLSVLMGVPAIAFGATIPAILKEEDQVARDSGRLLFLSCVANALGFLILALFLHQALDYGQLVLVVGLITVIALVAAGGPKSLPIALLLVVCGFEAHRVVWKEAPLYLGYTAFQSKDDFIEATLDAKVPERFKGHQDTFSISNVDGTDFFYINGYLSFPMNSVSEKIVGAIFALFAPRTDRALVLGLGSGVTAATVTLVFDRTDAVEINPAVVANLHRMSKYNCDMVKMKSVHPIIDDANHHIKRGTERFPLILNTVTSPLYFSSSKLYTREFLAAVKRRLTPDGIYVTWVDSRVGDRGMDILSKTVTEAFPYVRLCAVTRSYFVLIGSMAPPIVRRPELIADNPTLKAYFLDNEVNPADIAYGLLHPNVSALVGEETVPIHTIDRPSLEFEMASLRKRGIPKFKKRLTADLDGEQIRSILEPAMKVDRKRQFAHLDRLVDDNSPYVRKLKAGP